MSWTADADGRDVFVLAPSDIAITHDGQRTSLVRLLDRMRYSRAPAELYIGKLESLLCPALYLQPSEDSE